MKFILEDVLKIAQDFSIPIKQHGTKELRREILKAFDLKEDQLIQKQINEKTLSINDPDGSKLIQLELRGPLYLLFDQYRDDSILELPGLQDAVKIISECPIMTFYLVDVRLKTLVGVDERNILFMMGDTSPWPH